jgi:hypothetical protein
MHHRLALLIAGLAATTACSDREPGPTATATAINATQSQPLLAGETVDEAFVRIGRGVPGFGGMMVDSTGAPVVLLVDQRRQPEARLAAATLLAHRGRTLARLRFVQARYDFETLSGWRDRLLNVMAALGIQMLDVDEAHNRVLAEVEDDAAKARVVAAGDSIGIPRSGFEVRVAPRTRPQVDTVFTRSKIRPTIGGIQVGGSGGCTLGFNAEQGGLKYFVTASHCSVSEAQVDTVSFWQNGFNPAFPDLRVGVEAKDPAFRAGLPGCPSGHLCRYSDATLVKYDVQSDSISSIGIIARVDPSPFDPETTSPFIIWYQPPLRVIANATSVFINDNLIKVGMRTGWTGGTVINTCMTAVSTIANRSYVCQGRVSAHSEQGDSGSPVFMLDAGGEEVYLYGVLHGGDGLSSFQFSPMSGILNELGAMRTTY